MNAPDGPTAEWLTAALQGTAPGCAVSGIETRDIGGGRGYMGQTLAVTLAYAPGRPPGPESVVVKLPALEAAPTPAMETLRRELYATEIAWYRDAAATSPVRAPRCLWASVADPPGPALVLEDLSGWQAVSQVEGPDLEQARLAVDALARLHARWWRSPNLDRFAWTRPLAEDAALWRERFASGWPALRSRLGKRGLPAEFAPIGDRLAFGLDRLVVDGAGSGTTLIHGDYRIENLLFGVEGGEPAVCVLDWQLAGRGSGARDLAYFLGQNLPIEARRNWEPELIERYHGGLLSGGVKDYARAALDDDYRRGLLVALWMPAHFLGVMGEAAWAGVAGVDRGALRGLRSALRLVGVAAERNIAAITDHGAEHLLGA